MYIALHFFSLHLLYTKSATRYVRLCFVLELHAPRSDRGLVGGVGKLRLVLYGFDEKKTFISQLMFHVEQFLLSIVMFCELAWTFLSLKKKVFEK